MSASQLNLEYVDSMESASAIFGKLSPAQLRAKKPAMIAALDKIARGEAEPNKSWFGKIFDFFGAEN